VAVRLAAGEAGIDAYDGAYVDIQNPDGFVRDARAAQQLGFAGRSCIHPTQIALANDVFRPSDADIAHALKVVDAARESLAKGVGAFVVDGRLVDGPFITRAEHLVALARRLGLVA
jgi:citrate lyase subunit beta / citryl-CoA lyase